MKNRCMMDPIILDYTGPDTRAGHLYAQGTDWHADHPMYRM